MSRFLTLLLYSVLVFSASQVAWGQESQGQIKGTVKDSEGASVSGAEVSLLLANQAIARTALTDARGNFTLEKIPAGSYGLHVEHAGFLRHRSAVQLASGETREIGVVLQLNQIMENVTITAEPGQVTDRRKVDTQVNVIPAQEIFERAPEVVAQAVDEEPGVDRKSTRLNSSHLVIS